MKEQLKGFGFDDVVSADTEIALGYRESRAQAIKEAN
jgi:hypothetical protein